MSNQYLDILLHDSSYGEYNEYVNLENHQKHSMFILGGLAAALLLVSKKWGGFHGSYNNDEENQYEKALRMMRQARQANEQRTDRIQKINVGKAKEFVDGVLGYTTGHIESAGDDRATNNNHHTNWKAQTMYWDNLDTSGRWKRHMDKTWHTEDND